MIEADIQDPFAAWLTGQGIYFIQARRDRRSTIKVGHPDFSIFLPGGKTLFIETKRPGGKTRPSQVACIEKLRAAGFAAHVVDDLEKCKALVLGTPAAPTPTSPKMPGEHVIFGNGIFELRGQQMHPVRAATPADVGKLRRIQ